MDATLTLEETVRYSRHLLLSEVGVAGQRKLKAARVLCVGAGGLGSPAAMYLAAAGVGTIGLIDADVVDVSNLQRQIVHGTRDIGRAKVDSARDRLRAINPNVSVETHARLFDEANALALVASYDVVLDGSDNFPTRYLVNDACVIAGTPNAYGSVSRFEGQAAMLATAAGPCYRCLHPEPPAAGLIPSCAEGGVLGVLPGLIGTIQATETIKWLLGVGGPLLGRLLIYDALRMRFREVHLPKDPDCPVCGVNPVIRELRAYAPVCQQPAVVRAGDGPGDDLTVAELKARIDGGHAPVILDVREPYELQICRLPGSLSIPAGELPRRLAELSRDHEIVLHCRSGARSATATRYLRAQGFTRTRSLAGGILAWIDQVDPSLSKY